MKTYLEILSQGEEVITGQVADTNAAWLSEQAVALGFSVSRHTAVGDKLDDLILLLREIAGRADCCICTGGLGPTCDDLTTEAVSLAFDLPLVFDAIAFEQMQQFFARRNKAMPENNRKQALLPKGAISIANDWGTAVGFAINTASCLLIFLPGVPSEMKNMFSASVLAALKQQFQLKPSQLISIKSIGLGESAIAQLISDINIPDGVELGFRATSDEVQTKLLFPADYDANALALLTNSISSALGDYVFAIDGLANNQHSDLLSVINKLMLQHNKTLTVIESVSHGLLAAKCCHSQWLLAAHYQRDILAIDDDTLLITAKNLAKPLQQYNSEQLVLVQLYTGGLDNLLDNNKSITLYNFLFNGDYHYDSQHILAGSLQRKQNQAAILSLDNLRRYLQSL
jgi:competence/damage-inducible protein CinA-like protein